MVGNSDGVQFPDVAINTYLRAHVHTNNLQPIPSVEDIVKFAEWFDDKVNLGATDSAEIVSINLSRNNLYAMTIKDPIKVNNF